MRTKICDKDCFNCIYTDCILDGSDRPVKEAKEPKELKMTKQAVRMRKYYIKNREKINARTKAYYWEHREEINARRRKK